MARADTALSAAASNTVRGVVGKFCAVRWAGDLDDYRRLAPYAVLFLRWEADSPELWRTAGLGSPWPVKKRVLRQFADMDVLEPHVDALTQLTLGAINRSQRCNDLGYVLVARALDGPVLRAGIDAAVRTSEQTVRLRAGYVHWALENPQAPVTLASWRAWRVSSGGRTPTDADG